MGAVPTDSVSDSRPAPAGTSIRSLPETPIPAPAAVAPAASDRSGGARILIVEDEEALRKVARRSLEAAGYTVLTASAGDEALLTSAQHAGTIHLLLTDVVMPRMSGKALAQALLKRRPMTKVLYMSGYADNAFVHHGVVDEGTYFLSKPFTATDITRKVRAVLDSDFNSIPDGHKQGLSDDA